MEGPQVEEATPNEGNEPTRPRWRIVVEPAGNGEAKLELMAHADDVRGSEIAYCMSRVVTHFLGQADLRMPTVEEVQENAELAKDFPATRIFSRNQALLWLGEAAVKEHRDAINAAGWIEVGEVPLGALRACDYVRAPEATAALWAPAFGTGA